MVEKLDYILTPVRYVGIAEAEDDGEPFQEKMERLTSELSEMFEKSHQLKKFKSTMVSGSVTMDSGSS